MRIVYQYKSCDFGVAWDNDASNWLHQEGPLAGLNACDWDHEHLADADLTTPLNCEELLGSLGTRKRRIEATIMALSALCPESN